MRGKLGALAVVAVTGVLGSVPALPSHAQSLAPILAEYRGKSAGRFVVTNAWDQPMNVVLEPVSFQVDDEGRASYGALDPSVRVRLSITSFRIPPKQTYTVFYEATADHRPAWFTVYATLTGPRPTGGMQLAYRLPHTVYLLPRGGAERDSIRFTTAMLDSSQHLEGVLESHGAFARVQRVVTWKGRGRREFPGFPVFPGQKRRFRLETGEEGPPDRVVVEFERFRLERAVSR